MNIVDKYYNVIKKSNYAQTMGLDDDAAMAKAYEMYSAAPFGNTIQPIRGAASFYKEGKQWQAPVATRSMPEYWPWENRSRIDPGTTGYIMHLGDGRAKYIGPRGSGIMENLTTYRPKDAPTEEDDPKTLRKQYSKSRR